MFSVFGGFAILIEVYRWLTVSLCHDVEHLFIMLICLLYVFSGELFISDLLPIFKFVFLLLSFRVLCMFIVTVIYQIDVLQRFFS